MKKTAFILFSLLLVTNLSYGQVPDLFDENDILEFTLTGPVGELMKDRGDDPQYHDFQLSYLGTDKAPLQLAVQVKVRGHFRKLKQNCTYPPFLISFTGEDKRNTVFGEQKKLKLVTPCREEKFVIREYLVYQLYQLTTPKSFRARLVKFTLKGNDKKGKSYDPLYGILLEEEDQMANRNNMITVEGKLVKPQQTNPDDFLNMAVFEYLIGNTDWSVQYLQNVKLIAVDSLSTPYTVPYDFDHAGLVGAPYAFPTPELELGSTRERRYRGYCIQEMKQFEPVIARYNQLKGDIYKVYAENALLEDSYRKSTLRYLDEFYETVNDPKKLKSEFQYPCRADGTGNVVIKGLKKE
jgi:hypothetical protein